MTLTALRELAEWLPEAELAALLRALKAANGDKNIALTLMLEPRSPSVWQQRQLGPAGLTAAQHLRLKQLVTLFPTVDALLLRDLFAQHRHSLAHTVHALRSTWGLEPAHGVPLPDDRAAPEPPDRERAMHRAKLPPPLSVRRTRPRSALAQELADKPRAELLRIAHDAARQRSEYYQRAARAYAEHDAEAVTHWQTLARQENERVHEAQELAALHLADATTIAPSTAAYAAAAATSTATEERGVHALDLHGFLVREAIQVLDETLHRLSLVPSARLVKVVTGQGHHSGERGARIKPAVLAYLRAHHIAHYELNPGAYIVNVPKGWLRL